MMERKFYTDNFEKLLKENADQFKMYPSKKVWHGLYNDLHPGKRWPSITMSILFLFSLVIIGHLNTGNNYSQHIASYVKPTKQVAGKHTGSASSARYKKNEQVVYKPNNNNNADYHSNPALLQLDAPNHVPALVQMENISREPNQISNSSLALVEKTTVKNSTSLSNLNMKAVSQIKPLSAFTNTNAEQNYDELPVINNTFLPINNNLSSENKSDIVHQQLEISDKNSNPESNSINNSLPNKQVLVDLKVPSPTSTIKKTDDKKVETTNGSSSILTRIKKENISWTYYVSPSVSYRTITTSQARNNAYPNPPGGPANADIPNARQFPSVGIEGGTSVNYKLFKKIQFVTGFQVNYTRYNITANYIHPVMASLYLNSEASGAPYSLTAISVYGNGSNSGQSAEVTLHNYSFQASVPLGFQYEIFGNDKINLNAVATFQPSFTIANQSYILSTDKRNYLTDRDLMRTWNLNTSFGSYLSFKTNSLNWQLGPQIRYQILSTFISNYPGKEHLVDYGIRLGVSKNLR